MPRQGVLRHVPAAALAAALLATSPAAASPMPAGAAALRPNDPGAASHLLFDVSGEAAGFRRQQIPQSLVIAFQKGFVLDPAGAPATCTLAQAEKEQCPAESRLGGAQLGVGFAGDHYTAQLQIFRAEPFNAGDQGGAILYFKEPQSGFSGAGPGAIRKVDDGLYGEELAFDKLPLPDLPPGVNINLEHLQMDLGAGKAGAAAVPGQKKKHRRSSSKRGHRKVRLRCTRYRRHGHHRHCTRYAHGKRNHLPPRRRARAHGSAAPEASFITNPAQCPGGNWTVQLRWGYKDGTDERREGSIACPGGKAADGGNQPQQPGNGIIPPLP